MQVLTELAAAKSMGGNIIASPANNGTIDPGTRDGGHVHTGVANLVLPTAADFPIGFTIFVSSSVATTVRQDADDGTIVGTLAAQEVIMFYLSKSDGANEWIAVIFKQTGIT